MGAPRRIVSLLPSSTEIACALGLEARLVGRSHECDFPAWVATLPVCTAPKLDAAAPSREIDSRVKELVRRGLSVYRVDAERLRGLRPDLILTQQQCEVCAVTPRDLGEAVTDWLGQRPEILSLEPRSLGDVFADIGRVARAADVDGEGRRLGAELTARVTEIGERAAGARQRWSVVCLEWIDPLMAAGNWIPELLALAGGRSVLGEAGAHAPWTSLDALARSDPDTIVAIPCGFDLARTRSELRALAAFPQWRGLRAVREGRVFAADGNQYFSRPGPRLVESLEILAEILHPELFHFGHEGRAWSRP